MAGTGKEHSGCARQDMDCFSEESDSSKQQQTPPSKAIRSNSSTTLRVADPQITYWDAYDGQAIRIIDGSDNDEVNALAVDRDGEAIISGGGDKLVKLWGYDEGHCYYIGVAHSGAVTQVAVTPDKSKVVSVGAEGGIFIWDFARPSTLADL